MGHASYSPIGEDSGCARIGRLACIFLLPDAQSCRAEAMRLYASERGVQRFTEIADEIGGILDAHGQADHIRPCPGGDLLFRGELAMSRGRRMQDQAAR